jgi:hypothetical protein
VSVCISRNVPEWKILTTQDTANNPPETVQVTFGSRNFPFRDNSKASDGGDSLRDLRLFGAVDSLLWE